MTTSQLPPWSLLAGTANTAVSLGPILRFLYIWSESVHRTLKFGRETGTWVLVFETECWVRSLTDYCDWLKAKAVFTFVYIFPFFPYHLAPVFCSKRRNWEFSSRILSTQPSMKQRSVLRASIALYIYFTRHILFFYTSFFIFLVFHFVVIWICATSFITYNCCV